MSTVPVCPTTKKTTDKLLVVKMSPLATTPRRSSALAAGYDLYSAHEYVVPARGKVLAKTDIQICLPPGTYGRIAPRSGLAWHNHIDIGAGVVDGDYRGNVTVLLYNHSDVDFRVQPGDRIGQIICEKIAFPDIELRDSLDETSRGGKGFGSTGTN